MRAVTPLNLFYSEPDPDRWLPFDRYPRRIVRRIVRGRPRPGGVMRIALNLMSGLDRLRLPYRFNDHRYLERHPEETACIIGKPHVLFERAWNNPIVFGAGIFSHPSDEPRLLERCPTIRKILVPGPWMVEMFRPFYGDRVVAWPTGIDTEAYRPSSTVKTLDLLVYDKIRWQRERYVPQLLDPILRELDARALRYTVLRYGSYEPRDLHHALARCKAALFLCEHESQGLAYQQMLSSNVPLLAWDRGGVWQDPSYYPRIQFGPVTSVPYFSDACGMRFAGIEDFAHKLDAFLPRVPDFRPRDYILEHLTLEKCARAYVEIVERA